MQVEYLVLFVTHLHKFGRTKSWYMSHVSGARRVRLQTAFLLNQSTSTPTIVASRNIPRTCRAVASLVRLYPWGLVFLSLLSPTLSQHCLRD
jgi:hypothetical protein